MNILTATQLAQKLGAELIGDGSVCIAEVSPLKTAGEKSVTFLSDKKHTADLRDSQAGAVIVSEVIEKLNKPQLIVENVDVALIKVLNIFARQLKRAEPGIEKDAVIAEDAEIGKNSYIGHGVVIDANVRIGENSIINSGSMIRENSRVGDNCRIDSNVVIYHNCQIGNNVIIQANTVIGATGFGYAFIDGVHQLIPHNGGVVIEDFVEIGANTCIDRAKFGNTIIGAGSKIDNLVQIAHNVEIGKCCLIVAQVGIAGSAKIGNGVVFAGQSGTSDNVEIGDGVIVGFRTVAVKDIEAGKKVLGVPAIDFSQEAKLIALRKRLPKMADQLKQLSKRIERLEASEDNKK